MVVLTRLVQGHLDIPLNRRGRAQIQNVAKVCKSPFTRIYTSDLTRAVESAEIVVEHSASGEIVVDNALRDRYYGSLQGKRWIGEHAIPADAESQDSLTVRLQDWLSTLISYHSPSSSPDNTPPTSPVESGGEETVLVVTHEECIMTLLNILIKTSTRMSVVEQVVLGRRVGNGSLGIVRVWWEGGMEARARLEAWASDGLRSEVRS